MAQSMRVHLASLNLIYVLICGAARLLLVSRISSDAWAGEGEVSAPVGLEVE